MLNLSYIKGTRLSRELAADEQTIQQSQIIGAGKTTLYLIGALILAMYLPAIVRGFKRVTR